LFVGLGNPGAQYEHTRHNIGRMVVEAFARRFGLTWKEDRRFIANTARGVVGVDTVHLLLPLTYMNLSGDAVRRYVDYFKIPLDSLVVVADDIALPFGRMRLRGVGSAGGHNGLKSVEGCLQTAGYKRLRMGIGQPGEAMLAVYVLENFSYEEQQELPKFIDRGAETLMCLMKESFSHVMTVVNTDLTKPPVTGRGE